MSRILGIDPGETSKRLHGIHALWVVAVLLLAVCSVGRAADQSAIDSSPPTPAPETATQQAVVIAIGAAADASKAGDYAKAYTILKPLADQGYFGPMYSVAIMDLDGQGTTKNVQAGLDLLNASGNAGYIESQLFLAVMYLTGYNVQSDYVSWYKWFDLAYKQDPITAVAKLDGIQNDVNATAQGWVAFSLYADIAKDGDYSHVYQWASASAVGQGAIGEYVLGVLYHNGYGIARDDATAAKLFAQSATQDLPLAENDLGVLYEGGDGVPRDYARAYKLYLQAANHGYSLAQSNLCRTYLAGRGIKIDVVQAYKWCNLAASQGDADAKSLMDTAQQQMTLDQINEAQKLSADWTPTTSSANTTVSQSNTSYDRGAKKKHTQVAVDAHKRLKLSSTGTGFYVTNDGSLVTNAHVVDECVDIRAVDGNQIRQLTLVAEDVADDLALLNSNGPTHAAAAFRDDASIQIGAHIVVLGYPLPDVLSGQLTLTDGSISALGGLGGAVDQFQFSAPIQPGNSGGPILDTAGRVTGISVAKLNSIAIAKAVGDVPENVNFGINEATIRAFLDIHSVQYKLSKVSVQIPDTSLGQQARNYTVLLQCWK